MGRSLCLARQLFQPHSFNRTLSTKLQGWTIDIIINNSDRGLDHPYHLHGADFYIVARGEGTMTKDGWDVISFNTTNPPLHDTLVILGGDYAVLRLYSNIPGVWPLHCHIA